MSKSKRHRILARIVAAGPDGITEAELRREVGGSIASHLWTLQKQGSIYLWQREIDGVPELRICPQTSNRLVTWEELAAARFYPSSERYGVPPKAPVPPVRPLERTE